MFLRNLVLQMQIQRQARRWKLPLSSENQLSLNKDIISNLSDQILDTPYGNVKLLNANQDPLSNPLLIQACHELARSEKVGGVIDLDGYDYHTRQTFSKWFNAKYLPHAINTEDPTYYISNIPEPHILLLQRYDYVRFANKLYADEILEHLAKSTQETKGFIVIVTSWNPKMYQELCEHSFCTPLKI